MNEEKKLWGRVGPGPWREDILAEVINKNNFKTVAELGVCDGYTAKVILRETKVEKYVGVDTWAHPDTFDILAPKGERSRVVYENWDHEDLYNKSMNNIKGYEDRCHIIRDTTYNASKLFEDHTFDLVFIDADHSYEGASDDIQVWYRKVKPGGVLAGHDFSWDGVKRAISENLGMDRIQTFTDDVWMYNVD